jgi:hypothetical protein
MAFSSEVERLLSVFARLPLIQAGFPRQADACGIPLRDAGTLFPGARHDQAALAGLLLRAGCWAESHTVAQDINSVEGSYWHGILHRMEPDSSNAAYWFRRVGKHAIFPELLRFSMEIIDNKGLKQWRSKSAWDPFLFIEWCDEACKKGGQAEAAAIEIQMVEWQLLFDWCCAAGAQSAPDVRALS